MELDKLRRAEEAARTFLVRAEYAELPLLSHSWGSPNRRELVIDLCQLAALNLASALTELGKVREDEKERPQWNWTGSVTRHGKRTGLWVPLSRGES